MYKRQDNGDIDAMLQIIYEERGLTLRDMTFANARDMIEIQKLSKRPDYYREDVYKRQVLCGQACRTDRERTGNKP